MSIELEYNVSVSIMPEIKNKMLTYPPPSDNVHVLFNSFRSFHVTFELNGPAYTASGSRNDVVILFGVARETAFSRTSRS